jgi:hypothetical protein
MLVIEIKRDGDGADLTLADLGNSFNRRGIITEESALDYSSSSSKDLLKYSFITDNRGLQDGNEETKNFNLII